MVWLQACARAGMGACLALGERKSRRIEIGGETDEKLRDKNIQRQRERRRDNKKAVTCMRGREDENDRGIILSALQMMWIFLLM